MERIIGDIAASGARILMTTHNLGQARRIAEQTSVAEFFKLPQTAAAQSFLQEEMP